MSNQDWTSKLQEQLADYQESVSHDLWAGIEQSLAHSETGKKARIVYFKRWSAAAAAVALLGIGGSYVYLHQEDVERVICNWLHLNPLHPTLFQRICNPLHLKRRRVMMFLRKNLRMKSLCLQRNPIIRP